MSRYADQTPHSAGCLYLLRARMISISRGFARYLVIGLCVYAVTSGSQLAHPQTPRTDPSCRLLPSTGSVPLKQVDPDAGEDLRAGMNCRFVVSRKLPVFTIHFVGRPDNTLGDIQVLQGDRLVQTITGHDVELGALYPARLNAELQSVDANFDGYQDLQLLNDCGATGNCDYDFYLYDPAHGRFVYNKFLSGLGTCDFNAAKKQVWTGWNTSVVDSTSSIYQFRNGRYTEIRREDSDENGTKIFERRNGKMVLIRTIKRQEQ